MLEKINTNEIKENISDIAKHAGVVAMTGAMALVAAEVGGIHPPNVHEARTDKRKIVIPAEAAHIPTGGEHGPNKENVRRAEEVGPHYVSYGAMHRTPARSGAA